MKISKNISIMVGISASGKSTYAKKLIDDNAKSLTLSADSIREELYGDANIQGDRKEVFGILFDRYINYLKDSVTELIIIDNTSLDYKARHKYWRLADTICSTLGYSLKYNIIFFEPNIERSLKWNNQRERQVPEDIIRKQFKNYQEATDFEKKVANIIKVKYE